MKINNTHAVLILTAILTISCRKSPDPYYNPNYHPGTTIQGPTFYAKGHFTGDQTIISRLGDSLNINVLENSYSVNAVQYKKVYPDTNYRAYATQYNDKNHAATDYKFAIMLILSEKEHSKVYDWLKTNKNLHYGSTKDYKNTVRIDFVGPDQPGDNFTTYTNNSYLNDNGSFEVMSTEKYTTPNDPTPKFAVKMRFTAYMMSPFGQVVKLEGEATGLF